MSSSEICKIMKQAIQVYFPTTEVVSVPVADGGEGSVASFLAVRNGKMISATVKGPFFHDMEGFYGVIDGNTAIIEMASCAGLPLVGDNGQPDKTTTYGVGQLIVHAARHGCKKIIVGLGGSCTNDGGTGAAAAAGITFYDQENKAFIPTGGTLSSISRIDRSGLIPEVQNAEIITMCDIDNPLYGKNGAAYVFGPQKGADSSMVELLDRELKYFADIVKRDLKVNIAGIPGAGAAGGMGAGMSAFFGSRLQMGIETVLDTVNFDSLITDADLIITGEGRIDSQSLRGKVVIGVARRIKKRGIPVIAVVGDIGDNIEPVYDEGVSAVFSINRVAIDFAHARTRSKNDLALTMDNLMRFMKRVGW